MSSKKTSSEKISSKWPSGRLEDDSDDDFLPSTTHCGCGVKRETCANFLAYGCDCHGVQGYDAQKDAIITDQGTYTSPQKYIRDGRYYPD